MPYSLTDTERFWSKVDKTETCWLWSGAPNNTGYGVFGFKRTSTSAHRVAYELIVGPIPDGLHLDHLCRVRLCVNPSHLEPVTQLENNQRAITATHCINGHEFTVENTRVYPNVKPRGRYCLPCKRARGRATAAKRRLKRQELAQAG